MAAFAREWKAARHREQQTCGRGAFVPLTFMPGEAFQFDWSEDWAIIAGERTKLQVAQFKLSYSRAFFLRAYPQQTHEMLFDDHNHAFRVLGGVPRRGIYKNDRGSSYPPLNPSRTLARWMDDCATAAFTLCLSRTGSERRYGSYHASFAARAPVGSCGQQSRQGRIRITGARPKLSR